MSIRLLQSYKSLAAGRMPCVLKILSISASIWRPRKEGKVINFAASVFFSSISRCVRFV